MSELLDLRLMLLRFNLHPRRQFSLLKLQFLNLELEILLGLDSLYLILDDSRLIQLRYELLLNGVLLLQLAHHPFFLFELGLQVKYTDGFFAL